MTSTNAVVHLVDDDESVRQSVAFLLATAGFAVRVYESGSALLDVIDTLQPGCVVSDVRMPGIDGLELQRRLKASGIRLPVIIMTGHADVALAVQAMKDGAIDFIEKPFDEDAMLAAIRNALGGFRANVEQDAETSATRAKLSALSARERQVLDGLLAGHPNKTIAYDLGISPRTVEVHRANLMAKMGAASLSDLVRMVLRADPVTDR
ncbi:response regulator FixJ [Aurantimonas sp. VKM B-3413]|uniref:response regulator FixJ n=1 Tax=Aurantimonas sp. VKM B-3413 TaxID=2779401 RepID=UPI001E4C8397|nr:response regulator FixJ [Aurantimonas sp. VKM B-3413]MCB8838579.1 response regulator transcription factor FixJ [Aurantimonas sp. VKM B-3413]